MMADTDQITPKPRPPSDLPPHVREFLAGLDKEETAVLGKLLRTLTSFGVVCKFVIWIVAAGLGAMILLSQAADAIKKLGPLGGRFAIVAAAALSLLLASSALADDKPPHSNPWLLEWIPATCCVTNDCCWQISEREVRPLPNDEWQVVSTGQIRKRTDWSPDGRYYRCACDYDSASQKWIRHQGANTRCIFVPMQSVLRLPM